jgi:2-dehydro-3-deoxyphosphogluconate aldolase / (4S)-4-hydroxy-2-oxoglutarate aldolase
MALADVIHFPQQKQIENRHKMNKNQVLQAIEQDAVVAVMRGHFPPDVALPLIEALLEEGIHSFEFTTNSTRPIEAMQAAKSEFGDAIGVGMGTVLDVDMVRRVLDLGADFVVSPAFQPSVVEVVHQSGSLVIPGVITPSEAVLAWEMGVKLLKLFPIGVLGEQYFRALFGPLDHMKFMCNGGITAENAAGFLKAGAVALGMAGWLTGDGYTPIETIRARARQLKTAVDAARGVPRMI